MEIDIDTVVGKFIVYFKPVDARYPRKRSTGMEYKYESNYIIPPTYVKE